MLAKYLIRFDDLCPTMDWDLWNKIERILLENRVKPLLAVIPCNEDSALVVDKPNDEFWQRVVQWQNYGWTIALHGYRHVMHESSAGLIRVSSYSEFAGVDWDVQSEMIASGIQIMLNNGVVPKAWVAPAHSFDMGTLNALRENDINIISDGHSLYPLLDSNGMFWIPQSFWRFRRMPLGVWTICFHHNSWGEDELDEFERNIGWYKNELTDVDGLVKQYGNRETGCYDLLLQGAMHWMIRAKRRVSKIFNNA